VTLSVKAAAAQEARNQRIFDLHAEGLTVAEIRAKLDVTETVVRWHLSKAGLVPNKRALIPATEKRPARKAPLRKRLDSLPPNEQKWLRGKLEEPMRGTCACGEWEWVGTGAEVIEAHKAHRLTCNATAAAA
jgi:hypothetical protein